MPRHLVHPSLADLPQDFAGSIPVDLVRNWVESDKTAHHHQRLLQPFMVTGTIVSSDSAGLSKISQERSLLEVTQLVSQPKEIIYSYGKAKHLHHGTTGVGRRSNSLVSYYLLNFVM